MLLTALLLILSPTVAWAAREPFNEVLDNEVLPARATELQSRITDRLGPVGETMWWWGASFGLSPTVELVLPAEIGVSHVDGTTRFKWFAAELRWRIAPPGPPPGPGHPVPLVRLSVERSILGNTLKGGGDIIVGTDLSKALHSSVMAGGTVVSNGSAANLHGGLGITGNVTPALRIGGEVFGDLPVLPTGTGATLGVGPDASLTVGAFWITAGTLIGVGSGRAYDASVRIAWGIEL